MTTSRASEWFLTRDARDNSATQIDEAFTAGNLARPLVHGDTYFAEVHRTINAAGTGDLVWFTDWQSDCDQQLSDDPGSTLVDVRALVWRSQPSLIG